MTNYPPDDTDFEDFQIASVRQGADGTYSIELNLGHLWCGKDCPVVPVAGQPARTYGKGMGYPVRGLFINGTEVWYRTEAEQKEWSEISLYGANAEEWLSRWDHGDSCWSVEMGGLGPGYEQCIQITAAEIIRWLIANQPDLSQEGWPATRQAIEDAMFKNELIGKLGLSGAQYGAAVGPALPDAEILLSEVQVHRKHEAVSGVQGEETST